MSHAHIINPRPRRVPRRVLIAGIAVVVSLGVAPVLWAERAGGQGQVTTLDAARARVRALEANLVEVDALRAKAADAYGAADARLTDLRDRIAGNADQQRAAARNLVLSRERLAARLAQMYAEGTPSMVEVLMGSGSLTSAMDSYDMVQRVARRDRDLLLGFKRARTRLADLRVQLIADRREAVTSRTLARARLDQMRSLVGERRRLLVAAQSSLTSMEASAAQRVAVRRAAERAAAGAAPGATPQQVLQGGAPAPPVTQDVSLPQPAGGDAASHLVRIAQCESGGNPRAVSSDGQYRGKYQFTIATWQGIGGVGDPIDASEAEQDRLALRLYETAGPGQWPVCSQG